MQTDNEVLSKRQDQPALITPIEIDNENLECTVHPKSVHDRIRAGQEAWKRLSSGHAWNDWLLVGEALLAGRLEAMCTAHTNKAEGRRYNEEFGDWLRVNGFDAIEATTRKRLLKCLEHRNEIQAWRATLATNKLHELNHPGVILRRWQKNIVKKLDDVASQKLSHTEKLKASIIALEEDNARMKREIERGGGDLWTAQDTSKDIAYVIFRKTSQSKAREIARELNRLAREVERATAPQTTVETHA
jgi:hypothetical protein